MTHPQHETHDTNVTDNELIALEAAYMTSAKTIERFIYVNAPTFARRENGQPEPGSAPLGVKHAVEQALTKLNGDMFARVSPAVRNAGMTLIQTALDTTQSNARHARDWAEVLMSETLKCLEIVINVDIKHVYIIKKPSVESTHASSDVPAQAQMIKQDLEALTSLGLIAFLASWPYMIVARYSASDPSAAHFAYHVGKTVSACCAVRDVKLELY